MSEADKALHEQAVKDVASKVGTTPKEIAQWCEPPLTPNLTAYTVQQRERVLQLEQENMQLQGALSRLANEANGFRSMADPLVHGYTNMAVLGLRIDEARAILGGQRND